MKLSLCFLIIAVTVAALARADTEMPPSDDHIPNTFGPDGPGPGDRLPQVYDQTAPEYPFSLRLAGNKGEVIVDFILDPQGNVVRASVIKSSHPDFEAPAVEAVLKWKFHPGLRNGHPVWVHMQVPVRFELNGVGGVDVWQVPDHAPKGVPKEFDYDQPPAPKVTSGPVYPFDLMEKKTKGEATVLFAIDPHGHTHLVKLESASLPPFGASASAMILAWSFAPAQKSGQPCWALLRKKVTFNFNDDEFPVNDSARRLLKALKKEPCPILVSTKGLDLPLRGRFQPSPAVPDSVLKAHVPAQALISFIVDHAGHAQLPQVVSATSEDFGWAAATAVARWQFTTPLVKGRPVDVRATIPIVWAPPATPGKAG